MKYASVALKWNKEKTFDYLVPEGLDLAPGDKVIVETKRGETEVEVVSIKDTSDMASKPIVRKVEPVEATEAPADVKPAEDWNF